MPTDPSFRMTVEDVFFIRGRGTVVTGKIEQGVLKVGDEVQLKRADSVKKIVVTGIEVFHKQMNEAGTGENVGVLLKDIVKDDVQRGDVLTGPDAPGTEFSWNF